MVMHTPLGGWRVSVRSRRPCLPVRSGAGTPAGTTGRPHLLFHCTALPALPRASHAGTAPLQHASQACTAAARQETPPTSVPHPPPTLNSRVRAAIWRPLRAQRLRSDCTVPGDTGLAADQVLRASLPHQQGRRNHDKRRSLAGVCVRYAALPKLPSCGACWPSPSKGRRSAVGVCVIYTGAARNALH